MYRDADAKASRPLAPIAGPEIFVGGSCGRCKVSLE